jgi:hypothetical protein
MSVDRWLVYEIDPFTKKLSKIKDEKNNKKLQLINYYRKKNKKITEEEAIEYVDNYFLEHSSEVEEEPNLEDTSSSSIERPFLENTLTGQTTQKSVIIYLILSISKLINNNNSSPNIPLEDINLPLEDINIPLENTQKNIKNKLDDSKYVNNLYSHFNENMYNDIYGESSSDNDIENEKPLF